MDKASVSNEPSGTATQRQNKVLRQERDRFVALAFCAADVLFEADAGLIVTFAAGATGALAGRKPEELIGRPFIDLVAADHRALVDELCHGMRAGTRLEPATVRLNGPDGPTPLLVMTGYHLPDLAGRFFFALRLHAASIVESSSRIVRRDPETGLLERHSFAELASERVRAAARRGETLQFSMVQMQDFMNLRTRLDHETDANLLETLGACLRANSVEGETACRFDDASYGLLHRRDLDIMALKRRIEDYARTADPRGIGAEVAAGTVEADPSHLGDAAAAQALMFTLRKLGKSDPARLAHLHSDLDALVADTAQKMSYFRRIAAGGDFDVAFQPIVDVTHRKLHHYEALVRFNGEVDTSPYEMIRLAENTGLIAEFDFAMCRKVLAWIAATAALRRTVVAAVNVSGQSISDPRFVERLRVLLDAHPTVRGQLLFEITESAQVRDIEATNEAVQWLRRAGHKICLDDFGAGAAAMRYLQSLDVDIVKIDGHYIRSAMESAKHRAFLRAVIGLCRELGIATIAEMVEDEACLAVVRDCGIDLAQGYLFGRPTVVLRRNADDAGRRAADGV